MKSNNISFTDKIRLKSIKDFGSQWDHYKENQGYFASLKLFRDIIEPLLKLESFDNKVIAEVGSGNGRIIDMLYQTNASSIYSIEPSEGYKLIEQKYLDQSERIKIINKSGHDFCITSQVDIILSIGVLHHIPDPDAVLNNCLKNLKPGGKIFIWLYGREGNIIYINAITILRIITTKIPDSFLKIIVEVIYLLLSIYMRLSLYIKLPMKGYINNVICKMDAKSQKQIIFDQLNPIYAKYYKKDEVFDLLARNGFRNIRINHRHSYSYSALAYK